VTLLSDVEILPQQKPTGGLIIRFTKPATVAAVQECVVQQGRVCQSWT